MITLPLQEYGYRSATIIGREYRGGRSYPDHQMRGTGRHSGLNLMDGRPTTGLQQVLGTMPWRLWWTHVTGTYRVEVPVRTKREGEGSAVVQG